MAWIHSCAASYVAEGNLFAATVRRVRVFSHSGGVLILRPAAEAGVEPTPRVYGFPAPDPEPGCDAHNEAHKVLQHEDGVVRGDLLLQAWAHSTAFPAQPEVLLVEVTRDDDSGRNCVQDAEDADPDHEFLQFVRLPATLLLDDLQNTEVSLTSDIPSGVRIGKESYSSVVIVFCPDPEKASVNRCLSEVPK